LEAIGLVLKLLFSYLDNFGNFRLFLHPFNSDLLVAVLVAFNVLLLVIWGTDRICLFYRNKRRGRKKEHFTILGESEFISIAGWY
jgi:hypothetical protein